MLYDSYEQVVMRDQPAFWWRIGTPVTTPSVGTPGLNVNVVARSASQYAGPGIPGAASGISSHTLGTSQTLNAQGWATSAHTMPGTLANGITYEAWAMPVETLVAGRFYSIFTRDTTGGLWYVDRNFAFSTAVNASAQFEFTVPQQQAWTHLVGIYRGGNHEFYVNGQRSRRIGFGTPETAGGSNPTTSLVTYIGHTRNPVGFMYSFPGFIAEPALYPYALSPSQIHDHYMAGIMPRRSPSRLASVMTPPFVQGAPPPPPPSGLTTITTPLVNRRVAVVSDRPR